MLALFILFSKIVTTSCCTCHFASGHDWGYLVSAILDGAELHDSIRDIAAKLLASGMADGAAVNLIRGWMESSRAPRDARWQARFDDIPRAVDTARGKYARPETGVALESVRASKIEMEAIAWLWPDRFALGKLGLIVGLPDEGKGQVLADMAARVTRGDEWPCGEGKAPQGNVVLLSAEDDPRDTVVPRLAAAGADLSRIWKMRPERQAHWRIGIQRGCGLPVATGRQS
jgi:hypothetical protein